MKKSLNLIVPPSPIIHNIGIDGFVGQAQSWVGQTLGWHPSYEIMTAVIGGLMTVGMALLTRSAVRLAFATAQARACTRF